MEEQQRREVERDLSYRRYYNSVEAKIKNNYENLRKFMNPNLSVDAGNQTAPSHARSETVSPANQGDKF